MTNKHNNVVIVVFKIRDCWNRKRKKNLIKIKMSVARKNVQLFHRESANVINIIYGRFYDSDFRYKCSAWALRIWPPLIQNRLIEISETFELAKKKIKSAN